MYYIGEVSEKYFSGKLIVEAWDINSYKTLGKARTRLREMEKEIIDCNLQVVNDKYYFIDKIEELDSDY